ncbi:Uncharacterised protein r2_g2634 [Pycnogonum litorale]
MIKECLGFIPRPGLWLAFISGLSFSLSTITALIIEEIGPETLITFHYLLLVVVTVPFLVNDPEKLVTSWKCYFYIGASGVCAVAITTLLFYGLFYITPLDVVTLLNMKPFFLLFLGACFLKEPVNAYDLICVILISGGVMLVVQPEFVFGATSNRRLFQWMKGF